MFKKNVSLIRLKTSENWIFWNLIFRTWRSRSDDDLRFVDRLERRRSTRHHFRHRRRAALCSRRNPGQLPELLWRISRTDSIIFKSLIVWKQLRLRFPFQGGIMKPNDGTCSTKREGAFDQYTDELKRDYPSFSQVKSQIPNIQSR